MLVGNCWSRRRIARELKIDRETVSVYPARAGPPKPAMSFSRKASFLSVARPNSAKCLGATDRKSTEILFI
jgi:hypothetical protein